MPAISSAHIPPIVMLIGSNIFMTFAQRASQLQEHGDLAGDPGELDDRAARIHGRAANRIGSAVYSAAELKTMQEVITLTVFAVSRCSG